MAERLGEPRHQGVSVKCCFSPKSALHLVAKVPLHHNEPQVSKLSMSWRVILATPQTT
jgi:hypothetical protein